MKHYLSVSHIALLAGALALGCSSSSSTPASGGSDASAEGSTTGSGGKSGSGGSTGAGDAGSKCSATVAPSSNDPRTIQTAIEKLKSGDTLCFSPGKYSMDRAITLTAAKNITFRGTGAKREDVLLDFAKQSAGDGGVSGAEGVLVTTEGFTIEKLWIKNTAGNGIKVQANNSTFRNIKVGWDKTQTSNGAYALYPVNATNTLMEDNEVYGAADAGIYAGQCTHVIARGNVAHDNVLGIEIENTTDADIYKNEVYNNTCGFLIDLLPGLDKKDSKNYLVHDNKIHDNNLPNFGVAKTLAGVMPQGTGMFVYGGSDREITKNTFENNDGVALNISSQDAIDFFAPSSLDPKTSRWPERIYVHDNTFVHNGTNPVGIWGALAPSNDAGKKVMPYNILWDGILAHPEDGGAYYTTPNAAAAKICLGATEQTSFLNAHIVPGDATSLGDQARWTTDPTDHKCTLPALPALTP